MNLVIIGLVIFFIYYIFAVGSSHSGRHGAPCYCKPCENQLIERANMGDIDAKRKLILAIQGGEYVGYKPEFIPSLGPFKILLALLIMVFIVQQILRPDMFKFLDKPMKGKYNK
jgi:hypothetical protein